MEKLLLTPSELAECTGVSRDRVEAWLMQPDFPAFRDSDKAGSRTLIPVDRVREWFGTRGAKRLNMREAVKRYVSE